MKKLLIATFNSHKLNEFRHLLKDLDYEIVGLKDIGITQDVEEDQDSYKGNALLKAKHYGRLSNMLTLADDSGIEIAALNFLPGIYSARFLGKATSYEDKNKIILSKVKDNRDAEFVCAIALVNKDEEPIVVEARVHGKIGNDIKGIKGFGYDPIFIPDGYTLSFAQMSEAEKNKVSHRAKAVELIKKFL
jgi:XTP/dITP diphosphohydrolase